MAPVGGGAGLIRVRLNGYLLSNFSHRFLFSELFFWLHIFRSAQLLFMINYPSYQHIVVGSSGVPGPAGEKAGVLLRLRERLP